MLKNIYNSLFPRHFHENSMKKFRRLKQTLSVDNILVLGNGPSLNCMDTYQASKFDIRVACNHFYNHPLSKEMLVDFYCISDPRLLFPIDFYWLNNVKKCSPDHLVVPSKFFYLSLFYRNKLLFYNYEGDKKIWLDQRPCLDISASLPSGDTVVCDISIPLAVSLGAKKITFIGVDLTHSPSGVKHAYDESKIKSKRRDDNYLINIWPSNTSRSLYLQFRSILQMGLQIEVINPSSSFSKVLERAQADTNL